MMTNRSRLHVLLCSAAFLLSGPALVWGQQEPYTVYDTKPVLTQGPYLVATSDTTATVVWMTDTPSHSKVRYGTANNLSAVVEPQKDGLVPVGTLHVVHLTGLKPGQTYQYQVVSTRVVKLKPYWPDKGITTESPVYSFTTLDPRKPKISFSFITDTHEDIRRINTLLGRIDWSTTDFLVHGGDAFHWIDSEEHLFRNWLEPTTRALQHRIPLVFARGNHELRGAFARSLFNYVPTFEDRYYFARDHGPVHLLVIDSGEDKPDDTNVYAELNRLKAYREQQFAWLQEHVRTSRRLAEAPFRVVVMHQPHWGWVDGQNDKWTALANKAGVDLVIAGHTHRFAYVKPGERGNNYHLLIVGQDQVATVDATGSELKVVVMASDGKVVESFTLPAKRANRT
jgi:predicted phosphodiesterase